MAEDEFVGNSNASKSVKQKPVTSNVVVKAESEAKKLKKKFFAEDVKTVGGHVLDTVVIPSVQKLVSDAVKGAIDWLIYGQKGSRPLSGPGTISYTSYYNRGNISNPSGNSVYSNPMVGATPQRNSIYSVNEVVFADRGEAEEVLLRMKEAISMYGMVSVADFYDLISRKSEHTDQKWGWRDLSNADIIRVNDGFMIRFPRILPIE